MGNCFILYDEAQTHATRNFVLRCPRRTVVPKRFRVVTQIKVAIMSYYPPYFAVISHNIEQHCGVGSALPTKNRILPPWGNLSPVWEPLT